MRIRLITIMLLTTACAPLSAETGDTHNNSDSFVVSEFGARSDGTTLTTSSIQKAIDAAHDGGGGIVHFPAGTYLTGTLFLKSNVTLHLANGATLLGSTRQEDYPPTIPRFRSYTDTYVRQSLLFAEDLENIAITGNGVIDGQGKTFDASGPDHGYQRRPYLIRMVRCQHIRVEGITFRNSPMWVQHYLGCDELVIDGITVNSRCNNNNDGINIDCCRNVRISDCDIRSGDDAIVLKSTADRTCENVTITNCVLSTYCNGLKFGTETNGGFKNVTISNCALYDVRLAGLTLQIVDGGILDGVTVSNLTMRNVGTAIFFRLGNRARPFLADGPRPDMGQFRNVVVSNVVATGCGPVGSAIAGLPGHPIRGITLSDVRITFAGGIKPDDIPQEVPENPTRYPEYKMFGTLPAYGLYCRHVEDLQLTNVHVGWDKPDARSALVCDDVQDLRINGFRGQTMATAGPVILLNGVRGAVVTGCVTQPQTNVFLRLEGTGTNVFAAINDLSSAKTPFEFGKGTPETALFQTANRIIE